ncbi:MAG: DUF5674 family protein [Candidatus Omnitrophota bacterium]
MEIIENTLKFSRLEEMAAALFGNMVKAVVDIERGLLAVDAELHSDLEAVLLEAGSRQQDLWGINLYPELPPGEFVEFDSMINIRPSQGNRSRGVERADIRERIVAIVRQRIVP